MTPPIKDLLPRLTPILKNRHEKVQENCIDLVGRIADRGAEYVSAREWMRICFELLDLLKAHKVRYYTSLSDWLFLILRVWIHTVWYRE